MTRDRGRDKARTFSQVSGAKMYIECARENPNARRALFPMLIGCATAHQYFRDKEELD